MAGRAAPRWAGLALLFLCLAAPGPCAGAEKADGKKKPWYWSEFKPDAAAATTIDKTDDFLIARNLWFHVQRFFAALDAKDINKYDPNNHTIGADIPFSQNVLVCKLPFTDVPRHYRNIQAGLLRGTTLWLDFPFPAFPENMGHWVEVLAPVYSALTEGAWKERAPDSRGHITALLFPNLRRSQVQGLNWVMDMLRLALRPGLASPRALPRMLFADELESLDPTAWLALERVLLVNTRYSLPSGRSGFVKPEHAAAFREAAYAAANISFGGPAWEASVAPPVITYLMAMNHEPVVNSGEVLGALREVGDQLGMAVRPYSVTPGAAFPSFVASMAHTGVLVARHGPLLANAMFLPPGAVVLELLPYNWEWQGISEIYLNLTRSVGCVHHFAWKANSSEWVVYLEPEDAKYSHWTPDECSSSYCLEAHARAGMLVDTQRLKEMLLAVLPDALKGAPVAELAPRLPWPAGAKNRTSVLWWA
jgi:hypothetical protein